MNRKEKSRLIFLPRFTVFAKAVGVCGLCVLLLLCPGQAVTGALDGIGICMNILIPSLFPFMVLCAYAINAGLTQKSARVLAPVARALFHLPGGTLPVILLSLVGGYPVGAKGVAGLLQKKEITPQQAARMLFFCVNAGPAFAVTAVGSAMLGRPLAGAVLYFSLLLSSLLIGVVVGLWSRRAGEEPPAAPDAAVEESPKNKNALTCSVADAGKSMLMLCGFVVLFSVLLRMLQAPAAQQIVKPILALFPDAKAGRAFFTMVLEVTNGVRQGVYAQLPVEALAAAMGFGGLCVHCQIRACFSVFPMKTRSFLLARLLHAGTSFFVCKLLLRVFPQAQQTFAMPAQAAGVFSVSAPAAAGLLALSVLLLLCVRLTQDEEPNAPLEKIKSFVKKNRAFGRRGRNGVN